MTRAARIGAALALGALLALAAGTAWRLATGRPARVCPMDEETRRDICSDRGAEVVELVERAERCTVPPVECRD